MLKSHSWRGKSSKVLKIKAEMLHLQLLPQANCCLEGKSTICYLHSPRLKNLVRNNKWTDTSTRSFSWENARWLILLGSIWVHKTLSPPKIKSQAQARTAGVLLAIRKLLISKCSETKIWISRMKTCFCRTVSRANGLVADQSLKLVKAWVPNLRVNIKLLGPQCSLILYPQTRWANRISTSSNSRTSTSKSLHAILKGLSGIISQNKTNWTNSQTMKNTFSIVISISS